MIVTSGAVKVDNLLPGMVEFTITAENYLTLVQQAEVLRESGVSEPRDDVVDEMDRHGYVERVGDDHQGMKRRGDGGDREDTAQALNGMSESE